MSILSEAPAGADVLDLNAAHAARAEARAAAGKASQYIKISAGYVEVRPEVPLGAAVDLQSQKIREGLAGLLVDPTDVDALLGDITAQDVEALTGFITGSTLGE